MITYSNNTFHAIEMRADGAYAQVFEAADWAAAEAFCRDKGWILDGRGGYQMTEAEVAAASPTGDPIDGANRLIAALSERDEGVVQ